MQAQVSVGINPQSGASSIKRTPSVWELFIGDRLTRSRLRFTAAAVIVVSCLLLAFSFATTQNNRAGNGLGLGSDYLAFYNAGTILNQHGFERLYDLDLQAQLYHENLPGEPDHVTLPYANAPFLAFLLRPIATLDYAWSYAAWVGLSLLLFASAFGLIWKTTGLPDRYRGLALLVALSFEPFLVECLHGGQISAFGIIWIALAIFWSTRGRALAAGLALSVCIYKPTLLPLILAMLLVMRQWRTLVGFLLGTLCLAATSVALVGTQPCLDYINMLVGYVNKTTGGGAGASGFQTWKCIDLNAFFKLLGVPSIAAFAMMACIGLLALKEVWIARPHDAESARRTLPLAWAAALTWTLVLNVYVGVYDSILLLPAIALTASTLLRRATDTGRSLPLRFRCLLLAIWVLPWFSGLLARDFGVQPYTVAILALGMYQIRLLQRRATERPVVTRGHVAHRSSDVPLVTDRSLTPAL